jgi:hypothetical protein
MKIGALIPRIGRLPVHWLAEGLLIVISVALGFWVAEFQRDREDRRVAARVLRGVQSEVEHNLRLLGPFVPMHSKWVDGLEKADTSSSAQSGLDVYFATRPPYPSGSSSAFPFLRRSAWDAAQAGGALRLIEYDVAAALSDVYRAQEVVAHNLDRLASGVFVSIALFDPAHRVPSVRLLWLTMADVASSEEILLGLYRKHLPMIGAAADGKR